MTEQEIASTATTTAETKQYKTRSLEVPSHKIDEFDTALENEQRRTNEATADAEYNRKKYGQAKDKIRELEEIIKEKDREIEYKNTQIASMRTADRHARNQEQKPNEDEKRIFSIVAERMLKRPGSRA